jgi:DNA processing protein
MDKQNISVALSLMSSGLWQLYAQNDPGTIYYECVLPEQRTVQDYYATWYSGTPLEESEKIIELCHKLNVTIISYWDDAYPQLLREIVYPPAVIYCKGILPNKPYIAIVGTRNADPKSAFIAHTLSGTLASAGIAVVSGLAVGIDREAHSGALKANGSTIGVMANGIDMLYPASNRDIYTDIINSGNGCVLSEYPPKVRINKWTFVRRNRIISGLSRATIIVKAGQKSGALITARYALEQNRELFVCPGQSFDEGYKGCFILLKEGAHPVYDENDIFEVLNISNRKETAIMKNANIDDTGVLQSNLFAVYDDDDIVKTLRKGAMEIDSLIRLMGKSSAEILEKLTTMELQGVIIRSGNIITLNNK